MAHTMSFVDAVREFKAFVEFGFSCWVTTVDSRVLANHMCDMFMRWGKAGVAKSSVATRIRSAVGEAHDDDVCLRMLAAFELKELLSYDVKTDSFTSVRPTTAGQSGAGGTGQPSEDIGAKLDDMMKLLTLQSAEIARLKEVANPPPPPRVRLTVEELKKFVDRDHLPQWAKDVGEALRVAMHEVSRLSDAEMAEGDGERDFEVHPEAGVWEDMAVTIFDIMVKNQDTYEARYASKGSSQVSPNLRMRGGQQFWVTKRGEWLPTADPPKAPCRRCLDKGRPKADAGHWFFQCPDFV